MAYAQYAGVNERISNFQVRNFPGALKTALVENTMIRGITLRQGLEEAMVLWLKRNGMEVPEFKGKKRARNALNYLAKQRKLDKQQKQGERQ